MSRVTMREVYRTLLDEKRYDWAEIRECAPAGVMPVLTMDEFSSIIQAEELLIDKTSIKQKWKIAVAQGVLIPETKTRARVNLSMIELKSGSHIPTARISGREREIESQSVGINIREGGQ